jgi:uncharacterized protein (TIGR02594 family)
MRVTAFSIASRYIGTRELPGGLDNPHILAWLMDAGVAGPTHATELYHDETAYCGAFVAHVAHLLGLAKPILLARARSWLTFGTPVELAEAKAGFDVVVLQRGDGMQPGPEVLDAPGHVGFYADLNDGQVLLLGANQSNTTGFAPFPRTRVLGVRRLFEE